MGLTISISNRAAERVIASQMPVVHELHISNSDFWIMAFILSSIGGVGIYEGMELHPVFYVQPTIILGGLGYFAFKAFYGA